MTAGPHQGERPATMWQWPVRRELVNYGLRSVALHLDSLGASSHKPTRLLLRTRVRLPDFVFEGRQQGYCKEPLPTPPATATGRMLAKPGTEARPPKLCESATEAGYHGPVLLRPRFRIGERWHNEHRLHHLDGQYCSFQTGSSQVSESAVLVPGSPQTSQGQGTIFKILSHQ